MYMYINYQASYEMVVRMLAEHIRNRSVEYSMNVRVNPIERDSRAMMLSLAILGTGMYRQKEMYGKTHVFCHNLKQFYLAQVSLMRSMAPFDPLVTGRYVFFANTSYLTKLEVL